MNYECEAIEEIKCLDLLGLPSSEYRAYVDGQKRELIRQLATELEALPGTKKEEICSFIINRLKKKYKIRGIEALVNNALGPEYKSKQTTAIVTAVTTATSIAVVEKTLRDSTQGARYVE